MFAGFCDHHEFFGATREIAGGEHGHAAAPHAGDEANGVFKFVGVKIVAAANDEIFSAAGEEELGIREIAVVAGVEPAVFKQRGGGDGVAEIAGCGRRAAKLHAADRALGQLAAEVVDHADFVIRQGAAAGWQA